MRAIRDAHFALRVVQRKEGRAGIIYRRRLDEMGRDRLQRVTALSPLAFTATTSMLREAVQQSEVSIKQSISHPPSQKKRLVNTKSQSLDPGPFYPLDDDWGARIACFGLVAAGLRDGERLLSAANHLRHADPNEAAWWLGLLTRDDNTRALRALRILTEAVQ